MECFVRSFVCLVIWCAHICEYCSDERLHHMEPSMFVIFPQQWRGICSFLYCFIGAWVHRITKRCGWIWPKFSKSTVWGYRWSRVTFSTPLWGDKFWIFYMYGHTVPDQVTKFCMLFKLGGNSFTHGPGPHPITRSLPWGIFSPPPLLDTWQLWWHSQSWKVEDFSRSFLHIWCLLIHELWGIAMLNWLAVIGEMRVPNVLVYVPLIPVNLVIVFALSF